MGDSSDWSTDDLRRWPGRAASAAGASVGADAGAGKGNTSTAHDTTTMPVEAWHGKPSAGRGKATAGAGSWQQLAAQGLACGRLWLPGGLRGLVLIARLLLVDSRLDNVPVNVLGRSGSPFVPRSLHSGSESDESNIEKAGRRPTESQSWKRLGGSREGLVTRC